MMSNCNGVRFKPHTREVGMESHPNSAFIHHRQPFLPVSHEDPRGGPPSIGPYPENRPGRTMTITHVPS